MIRRVSAAAGQGAWRGGEGEHFHTARLVDRGRANGAVGRAGRWRAAMTGGRRWGASISSAAARAGGGASKAQKSRAQKGEKVEEEVGWGEGMGGADSCREAHGAHSVAVLAVGRCAEGLAT